MEISNSPNQFGERAHEPATRGWRASAASAAPGVNGEGSPLLKSFMLFAGIGCAILFCALWWMLAAIGDDTPWLPSGLIAGIAMIACVVAREIAVRRYETRSVLRQRRRRRQAREAKARFGQTVARSAPLGALRTLERQLVKADNPQSTPEQHLEAYRACDKYLAQVMDALARTPLEFDVRAALRAGVERVQAWQRRHLLAWARKESLRVIAEAQRQANTEEKIAVAEQALKVFAEASRVYPEEPELTASAAAVREFIVSIHISHWIERAEREVFKGNYAKAIDHYSDALFDLTRADIGEDARREAAERITREVQLLRAHQATTVAIDEEARDATAANDVRMI